MGHGYLLQNLDFSCWNLGDTQALGTLLWQYWTCWCRETTLKTLWEVILGFSEDPPSVLYAFSYIQLSFSSCSVSKSCLTLQLQAHQTPCPLLSPGVCSDSCPLRWWCYLTISSSAALFSSTFHTDHLSFMLPPAPASMRTCSLSLQGGPKTQDLPSFPVFWESEC